MPVHDPALESPSATSITRCAIRIVTAVIVLLVAIILNCVGGGY